MQVDRSGGNVAFDTTAKPQLTGHRWGSDRNGADIPRSVGFIDGPPAGVSRKRVWQTILTAEVLANSHAVLPNKQ